MKWLWWILIIGILLRIILSISTFHPDIMAFKLGGEVVASGKVLNLYDYSNSDIAILNYPPLIYWFHGLFNFFFGSMTWMSDILLLKLPYLIFDILGGLIIFKFFDSYKKSILAFSFWMFNPISLYATYMIGQFDIIPTFFTMLSVYLVTKGKLNWAALALGGGIAFKLYPIFLLIPLVILGKNLIDKIKLILLALLPYALTVLPYLPSANFKSNALFASQSDKSLYANIPVSGGEAILLFPAALVFFYLLIWHKGLDKSSLWKIYLSPLLLFFLFTHYHPQWLIWITPFLIIDLVSDRLKNILPIFLIFGSWFGSLFFFDPSLTSGIFAPIWPDLQNAPSLWNLLNLNVDYNFSRSILQTISAGSFLYLIYQHLLKKNV